MSVGRSATALPVAVAFLLAICFGGSSAALQLQLVGANAGAAAYMAPVATAITLNCTSDGLPSGGSYSWSRSFGNPGCGNTIAGLNSYNVTTPLTSAIVTCYQCTYTYTNLPAGSTAFQTSSLLLYPFSTVAATVVDLAAVTSANLTCSNAGLSVALNSTSMSFVWTRSGAGSAALSGSVATMGNSILVVANSTASGGRYYCHGVMADTNISGYTTNGVAGAVLAMYDVITPPYAEMYAFSKTQYIEGDTVAVTCKVLGYPTPTVIWQREGASYSPTSVQNVSVVGGMNVSFTIPSLNAVSDRGAYVCIANGTRNGTALSYPSAAKTLHARTKLAPLWPAIGILAELALVAIIIGVTECMQAKKGLSAGGKGSAQLNGSTKHPNVAATAVVTSSG